MSFPGPRGGGETRSALPHIPENMYPYFCHESSILVLGVAMNTYAGGIEKHIPEFRDAVLPHL
ncbi:hypothetical protein E2C01_019691 [Portunus trituberculatus]|uniref:Uncharacterized protein n=1 Tax=Portunus trituberculatus TaxID=210409 RepID=A0A5B7DYM3_PORTR|nr:hypothetical protein [Portunus trituberculatus]